MAPDLNSLPPSAVDEPATPTARPEPTSNSLDAASLRNADSSHSPSPRSASISLQAAATLNAGLQWGEPIRRSSSTSISRPRQSPSAGRRRSQVLMNLQLADPSVPGPGEMIAESHMSTTADSHHARTPSLGELHQSLENEQEFQVNRLLQEIRRLQTQLAQRPAPQPHLHQLASTSGLAINEAADASVATSSSVPAPTPQPARSTTAPSTGTTPRSPGTVSHPRSSFDMARADLQQRRSRTPSRGASPKLRSTSFSTESGEPWILGGRDESAFYQAETQMLIRENQMLRHRIRELERQFADAVGTASGASNAHEPSQSSQLVRSTSVSEDDVSRPYLGSSMTPLPTVTDALKEG